MKIRPEGAELFRGDRRTDQTDRHDEANSSFSQSCEKSLGKSSWLHCALIMSKSLFVQLMHTNYIK